MKLTGKVEQITIMGQLEFIDGEEYLVNPLKNNMVEVKGLFHFLSTDTIEPITLTFHKKDFEKHLVV
jgi:hypothetical protein